MQESSIVRLCEKHGREISLYCYCCNECLCVLCLLSESEHSNCKSNMYSVQEDKLIASRWKETLEIEKEKLTHGRKENEAKSKSCTEQIKFQKEQMLLEITKVFDDLLKKVSDTITENEIELNDLLEETEANIAEIDDVLKETDSSLSAVMNRIETIIKARSKERTTMTSFIHYDEYTKSMSRIQKFCGLLKEGEVYRKNIYDEPQSELTSASEDIEDSIAARSNIAYYDVASQTEPKDHSNTVRSSTAHYNTEEPRDCSNTARGSNVHYSKDTDQPRDYSNTARGSNVHYSKDTDQPRDYSNTTGGSNVHYSKDTDQPRDYSNTTGGSNVHYSKDTDQPRDYSNTTGGSNVHYSKDTDQPRDYSNTTRGSNVHYGTDVASETDSYEEKNSVYDGNDPATLHGNVGEEEENDSVSDGNDPVTPLGNADEEEDNEDPVFDGNDPVNPHGNAGD